MPFTQLTPLIDHEESKRIREFALSKNLENKYTMDPKGSKLYIGSNTETGFKEIFKSKDIQYLCDKVMHDNFLESVALKLRSEMKERHEGNVNINTFRPYCHETTKQIYGKYAAWRSTLLPLGGNKELLEKLVKNNLLCQRLLFMPRIQLSIMRPGTYIAPHTDVSDKIASLMIYLPADISQVGDRLGTVFYYSGGGGRDIGSQKESIHQIDKKSKKRFEDARKERTFFGYGSSVLFFRTDNSWHSIDVPKNEKQVRVSININFIRPTDLNS